MMHELIRYSIMALEASGLTAIIIGAIISTVAFLGRLRHDGFDGGYPNYRANLGRCILLGLEFLIAADILKSVLADPTLDSVAVLAGIVLIRTFLSTSLEVEINGHWPWESTRWALDKEDQARSDGSITPS
jgi:uncharacterized membrane protein